MKGIGITALLYAGPPDFKGPNVMGQLPAQLSHGQVSFIPALFSYN